jgi:flagellar assembly protein FliH
MATEILGGEQPVHARMTWRSVPAGPVPNKSKARAEAQRETAGRIEQARAEGFAAGVAAARQEGEQKLQPAIQNLAAEVIRVAGLRDALRQQATSDLVQLAISMASRVLHREVSVDPGALGGLLTGSFAKLRSQEVNRASIHPALDAMFRQCLRQCGTTVDLVLAGDATLKPGELVFETLPGSPERAVHSDLKEIENGLADRLEE